MIYHEDDIRKLTLDEIAGIISEDDKKFLYQAITESDEAKAVWEQTTVLFSDPSVLHAMQPSPDGAYEAIGLANKRRSRARIIRWSSAAAAAVVVILCGIYFTRSSSTPQLASLKKDYIELQLPGGEAVNLSDSTTSIAAIQGTNQHQTLSWQATALQTGWAVLKVPAGKDYKVLLPDGSQVWLNAASSLRFPLTFTGAREVFVEGEAYFEVAANAAQPFVVHLPQTNVQVLGTAFNVNTYDSLQEKVSLVQGRVKVQAPADSLVLQPGYEVVSDGRKMEAVLFEENDVLAWRQGIHVFNKASLADINKVVKRMYNVEIDLHTAHAAKAFTGSLDRRQPLTSFLEILKFSGCISQYEMGTDGTVSIR